MIQDIDNNINVINDAIAWAEKYHKDSFPTEQFKEYRRKLSRIRKSLIGNCSMAAYGESQVGKSYLMSSLLSSADHPFVIEGGGREYSFIDELNPSGGNNAKIESTGVITRFTINKGQTSVKNLIKVLNLSVVDIILLLTDSYYNDIRINPDTAFTYDEINKELENLFKGWADKTTIQGIVNEDDIKDINDYIKDVIGNAAAAVYQSNFCKAVAPVIRYVPVDGWEAVFSLLWNKNPEITRLFGTLVNAYKRINFQQEVYVPFNAVLRDQGTLLKIEWLDTVCGVQMELNGNETAHTEVYDKHGSVIISNFGKGELSALIAELTFELPEHLAEERNFLRNMDLLDFPGARSREKYKEKEIANVLPKMLRRGKVAYLFNKYSRSLQISGVLFCHHNDQKSESTLGETINSWIEENIGDNPAERTKMLQCTNGIAPLFFVATKFNIDLEKTKTDNAANCVALDKHWNRFDTVFQEIIKPNKWLDEWALGEDETLIPFRNIYPLRDFYWSGKNGLFDGYSDGAKKSEEKAVHIYPDFPEYWECLKDSFLKHEFVRKHFTNPLATWESVATINNDGSKVIIKNLDSVSKVLAQARLEKCKMQLRDIKRDVLNSLQVFYEPENDEEKNNRLRLIAGEIRGSLLSSVAKNPAVFGRIIDQLMVDPESLRNVAYDIIIRHTDTPENVGSSVNIVRMCIGIDIQSPRSVNMAKLLKYYGVATEEDLVKKLKAQGLELEDIISKGSRALSTIGEVIARRMTDHWMKHLNSTAHDLLNILPHMDDVVYMLTNLFGKLHMEKEIADRVNRYVDSFSQDEQPNVIGDYAALTFNNFVSTIGSSYIPEDEISVLKVKAGNCDLQINFSLAESHKTQTQQPLKETLKALDDSTEIINRGKIDWDVLRRLPFWNNYHRWENLVMMGLVYSADISHCDPECNAKIKALMERTNTLYSA